MERGIRALAAALLATAAVGCNSDSSGNTMSPPPVTTVSDTVSTVANLTGYIYAVNGVGTQQYHRTWYATDTAYVGDNNGNADPSAYRGVLAFTLPPLPAGAKIVAATLTTIPCSITGNPFGTLGVVLADHLVATAAPDSATFDTTAIANNVATVLTSPVVRTDSASLTASVAADYAANATTSMYRLHFSIEDTDADETSKYVELCTSQLIVTYGR
jgi:hypothetical protein